MEITKFELIFKTGEQIILHNVKNIDSVIKRLTKIRDYNLKSDVNSILQKEEELLINTDEGSNLLNEIDKEDFNDNDENEIVDDEYDEDNNE